MSIEDRIKRLRKEYPEILMSDYQAMRIIKAIKKGKVKIFRKYK